jgi:5-methyltetrahydrofolate--homocysteine methyltransferase
MRCSIVAIFEQLTEELIHGNATAVSRLTREALDAGFSAGAILEQGLIAGMNVVGIRFRNCEMFLPEVLTSARAMKAGVEQLEPWLAAAGVKPAGKILVGTVKGDIHDIGKNLVAIMLRGAGFEVVDLGVGVTAQKFVEGVISHQPDIVGMSALLTTTMMQMKTSLEALRAAGVRDRVKVLVGGAPVNRAFAKEIGADAYGRNAMDAVEKARELMRLSPDLSTTGT